MSWICEKCETENPDSLYICEVCNSHRPKKENTSGNLTTPVDETWLYDEPKKYDGFSFPLIMPKDYNGKYNWEKIYNEPYEITYPFEYIGYLKSAAKMGDRWAQKLLARCYLRGSAVKKDVGEAVKWFIRAAEQGDADAALAAGLWYTQGGENFLQDKEEGIKWLKKADSLGHVDAKYYLRNELEPKAPSAHSAPAKSGCMPVIIFLVIISLFFFFFLNE